MPEKVEVVKSRAGVKEKRTTSLATPEPKRKRGPNLKLMTKSQPRAPGYFSHHSLRSPLFVCSSETSKQTTR